MAIAGEPYVLIGQNRDIAFTTTSEELVNQQVYVEQDVDYSSDPPTYRYKGRRLKMQKIVERIAVSGQQPSQFTIYRTVHGPVFQTDPANRVAYANRFASWKREQGSLAGFAAQGTATNLGEYTAAMRKVATLHNFFYADRAGQHRVLRRRPRPDPAPLRRRATRGSPTWATALRSGAATSRSSRMPRVDQPAPGLPRQLEHEAERDALLPAERRRRVLGHDLPVGADRAVTSRPRGRRHASSSCRRARHRDHRRRPTPTTRGALAFLPVPVRPTYRLLVARRPGRRSGHAPAARARDRRAAQPGTSYRVLGSPARRICTCEWMGRRAATCSAAGSTRRAIRRGGRLRGRESWVRRPIWQVPRTTCEDHVLAWDVADCSCNRSATAATTSAASVTTSWCSPQRRGHAPLRNRPIAVGNRGAPGFGTTDVAAGSGNPGRTWTGTSSIRSRSGP